MSALDEYEKAKRDGDRRCAGGLDYDELRVSADDAIESLKNCGNCKTWYELTFREPMVGEARCLGRFAWSRCAYTPSSWTERK